MNHEDLYPNTNFTTQKYFTDHFRADYSEINSDQKLSELIYIPNFNKKVSYLIKKLPYPDLLKIILKKLKFAVFQEKIFLDEIKQTIEMEFDEHQLKTLISEMNSLTTTSEYIDYVEGRFYGDRSQTYYRMKTNKQIFPRITQNFENYDPQPNNNMDWNDDLYD